MYYKKKYDISKPNHANTRHPVFNPFSQNGIGSRAIINNLQYNYSLCPLTGAAEQVCH